MSAISTWLREIAVDARVVAVTKDEHEITCNTPCGFCGKQHADILQSFEDRAGYGKVVGLDIEFATSDPGYEPGELLGGGNVPACIWCIYEAEYLLTMPVGRLQKRATELAGKAVAR